MMIVALEYFEELSGEKEDLHSIPPGLGLGLGVGSGSKSEEDLCKMRKSFLSELFENGMSCLEDD